MNLSAMKLPPQVLRAAVFMKRYLVLMLFLVFAALLGFLIFEISTLVGQEPSEGAVTDKLQTVQRPHIDQGAIDKIQQLQDQNVEVKSLFQQARDNPFSE